MDPLIARMYAAAADERLWPGVLEAFDATFGTVASWLLVFRERVVLGAWATGALRELANIGLAGCLAHDDWERDPALGHCLRHPTQAFHELARYFPPEVIAQAPMLQLMARNGLHHVTGAVLQVPGGLAILNLCRPTAAPFSAETLERLDDLHPHWAQAMQLSVLLGRRHAERVSQTLQRLDHAAAVLSHHGAVMACNAGFERYLPDWAALDAHQRLRPHQPHCRTHLRRTLELPVDVAPAPLALTGTSGQPYQLLVTHLDGASSNRFLGGHKLVTIRPETAVRRHSAASLQSRYALSAGEAELSCLMASGNNLRQAAAGLGITYASARTYLDRVYDKTGVHRQVDLVRLVLTREVAGSYLVGTEKR